MACGKRTNAAVTALIARAAMSSTPGVGEVLA
jgi:hypothetical protein